MSENSSAQLDEPTPARSTGDDDPDAKRRRLQLTAILLSALLYTSLPGALVLFTSGRSTGIQGSTGTILVTGRAASLITPLMYLLFVVCAIVFLANLNRATRLRAGRLLVVGISLAVFMVPALVTSRSLPASLTIIAAMALAIWSIGLRVRDLKVLGAFGFFIAALSLGMIMFTSVAWQIVEHKSLFESGEVLAGPFAQMNVLGMSLAVLIPFVGLFERRGLMVVAALTVAAALVLTDSRSSEIAAGVGLLAALLLSLAKRGNTRRFFFVLFSLITLSVMVWLPFSVDDPHAFTDRGMIWMGAIRYFEDAWLLGHRDVFGYGGALIQEIHALAPHGHNTAIHYLAMTGALGFLALLTIYFVASRNAAKFIAVSVVPAVSMMTFLGLGIAEAPHRVDAFDGPAWATWGALLCVALLSAGRGTAEAEPEADEAPAEVALTAPRGAGIA